MFSVEVTQVIPGIMVHFPICRRPSPLRQVILCWGGFAAYGDNITFTPQTGVINLWSFSNGNTEGHGGYLIAGGTSTTLGWDQSRDCHIALVA